MVVISNEKNATTQIGFENAVCANVPVFARFRDSGRTRPAPARVYRVSELQPRARRPGRGDDRPSRHAAIDAEPLTALPAPLPPAIRALPPTDSWVNVHTLGVKGDGQTDDTDAIRKAIDAHRVLYFPSGFYIVRDTITLKPDTVLIALHPSTTQLDLPDSTPGYRASGAQGAARSAAGRHQHRERTRHLHRRHQPARDGVLWMAGERSLLDDVQIHGFAARSCRQRCRSAFYGADRAGARSGAPVAGARSTRASG